MDDEEHANAAELVQREFEGEAPAKRVASGNDVHVNLGQSFMPREPTYERIILMEYGTLVQKFQHFGYRQEYDERAYGHMRAITKNYMMRRASQVPRFKWPQTRDEVVAWWLDSDTHHDRVWQIDLAMAEIENIMYETGLGLLRKPQPTKFDATRSDNDAKWLNRLTKDRARKLSEAVAAR
jgi:hypothetical protein